MKFLTIFVICLVAFAALFSSVNGQSKAAFRKQNAKDAKALQAKFATFTENTPCKASENACIGKKFAQCAQVSATKTKFVTFECAKGLECCVLPLVNKPGTSITCDTDADRKARFFQAEHNL